MTDTSQESKEEAISSEEKKTKPKKNGVVERHDPKTGMLVEKATFKDDVYHGLMQTFDVNGKIRKELNFNQGVLDGVYKQWDKDGQLMMELSYKSGKLHGPGKIYQNGVLILEMTNVDGLQDGVATTYFSDSQGVQSMTPMKAGKKDGEMKAFAPNGVLVKKCTYVQDCLQGDAYTYYADTGVLAMHEKYKDNKLHGVSVKYYPTGTVSEIATFDAGKIVKKPRKFKPNGAEI